MINTFKISFFLCIDFYTLNVKYNKLTNNKHTILNDLQTIQHVLN